MPHTGHEADALVGVMTDGQRDDRTPVTVISPKVDGEWLHVVALEQVVRLHAVESFISLDDAQISRGQDVAL